MKKNKPIKTRNWHAVNAWNRNSAGPIRDAKKQADRNACRDFEEDDMSGKLISLNYSLCGFEQDPGEQLVEEIKLDPTPAQIEKIVGSVNTYDCFPLTPEQIKDILNLEVDPDLVWFFETYGVYDYE